MLFWQSSLFALDATGQEVITSAVADLNTGYIVLVSSKIQLSGSDTCKCSMLFASVPVKRTGTKANNMLHLQLPEPKIWPCLLVIFVPPLAHTVTCQYIFAAPQAHTVSRKINLVGHCAADSSATSLEIREPVSTTYLYTSNLQPKCQAHPQAHFQPCTQSSTMF
jgi:hypothetical protein